MGEETLVVTVAADGIATMRYNRPDKLNSFTQAQHHLVYATFARLQEDPAVKALIITGTGRYFSAGGDFSESPALQHFLQPSEWRDYVANTNFKCFSPYLTFTKPIVAAVNGPAIGMGVTTVSLTDFAVATPDATFCTPFATLNVPAEGCSSVNFERKFGATNAAALLEEARTIDASTALDFGLVDEIVQPEQLLDRAAHKARELVQAGSPRPIVSDGLVDQFLEVNSKESVLLAETVISSAFFRNQMKGAMDKKQQSLAWVFWAMSKLLPFMDGVEAMRGTHQPPTIKSRL